MLLDNRTEQRVLKAIRKADGIQVDEGCVYLSSYQAQYFLMYTEGSKHITLNSGTERDQESSFLQRCRALLRGRFPRTYVVFAGNPLSWDGSTEPLQEEHRNALISRLQRAVLKKYISCRIEPR